MYSIVSSVILSMARRDNILHFGVNWYFSDPYARLFMSCIMNSFLLLLIYMMTSRYGCISVLFWNPSWNSSLRMTPIYLT